LIPIQVALTGSPDQEIASNAASALETVDAGLAVAFLGRQAGETELAWFGLNSRQPQFIEAILRRRDTPRTLMEQMAPRLGAEQQEILVLRQDAVIEHPAILLALEKNPGLTAYVKRRIWEYREHLLPQDKLPPKKAEEIEAEADSVTEEEMAEAIEEVKAKPGEGAPDEELGINPGQVRLLPVPIRVKLARKADRQMRALLIRDANSQVALTVMTANALSDQEVEQIASSRNVVREVLDEIPRRREWIRKYAVAKALVRNPRVPLTTAMKLVPRMTVKDLRELARDKNVAEGVRSMALRLYQTKT
jgi:hypothetical protein